MDRGQFISVLCPGVNGRVACQTGFQRDTHREVLVQGCVLFSGPGLRALGQCELFSVVFVDTRRKGEALCRGWMDYACHASRRGCFVFAIRLIARGGYERRHLHRVGGSRSISSARHEFLQRLPCTRYRGLSHLSCAEFVALFCAGRQVIKL